MKEINLIKTQAKNLKRKIVEIKNEINFNVKKKNSKK